MDDGYLSTPFTLRPPNWRAQTAARLATELRYPSPQHYDDTIRSVVEFLLWRNRASSNPQVRKRLPNRFATAEAAYAIHQSVGGGIRYGVEAQLLTSRTFEEIADSAGVSADVIAFFGDVHFDVRDRVDFRQFIVHEVLEEAYRRNPDEWRDAGWKTIAYAAGAAALDVAMGADRHDDRRKWLELVRAQSQLIVSDKMRRLAVAAGGENPTVLWKSAQLDHAAGKSWSDDTPNAIGANIQACMEALHFGVGKSRDEKAASSPYFGAAVELRAEEQVRVARGEVLENQDELLGLRIPEPGMPDAIP